MRILPVNNNYQKQDQSFKGKITIAVNETTNTFSSSYRGATIGFALKELKELGVKYTKTQDKDGTHITFTSEFNALAKKTFEKLRSIFSEKSLGEVTFQE